MAYVDTDVSSLKKPNISVVRVKNKLARAFKNQSASARSVGVVGIGVGDPASTADTFGVFGESKGGAGVLGKGTTIGVEGRAEPPLSTCAQGHGGRFGVFGEGGVSGVEGFCHEAGIGVHGDCDKGNGVAGTSKEGDWRCRQQRVRHRRVFTSRSSEAVFGKSGVPDFITHGIGVRGEAIEGIGVLSN